MHTSLVARPGSGRGEIAARAVLPRPRQRETARSHLRQPSKHKHHLISYHTIISAEFGIDSGTTSCILTMASKDNTATAPKNEEGTLLHVIDALEGVLGDIWTGSSNRKKISIVHHTEENPGGTMMSHDRAAPNIDANVVHGHHHDSDDDSYDDTPNSRRHSSVSDGEEAEDMSVDAEENDGEKHSQYHQTYALRQQLEDLASVDPEALRRPLQTQGSLGQARCRGYPGSGADERIMDGPSET